MLPAVAGDLSGAWEKLHWARQHRVALADEIREIIPFDPRLSHLGAYTVRMKCEREGNEYVFYDDGGPPLDTTRCALILGDALFNLRSALDHIVFQLHNRRYRGHIPSGVERRSAFPILNAAALSSRKKDSREWNEIGKLSHSQRRAIEFLQPYNTRNDEHVWTRRALDEINVLNVIDKHRRLHVIRAGVAAIVQPNLGPGGRYTVFFGPLEGKTEIVRWAFDSVPDDIAQKIDEYAEATVEIRLDEPGIGGQPTVMLDAYADRVEEVIKRFERFFR